MHVYDIFIDVTIKCMLVLFLYNYFYFLILFGSIYMYLTLPLAHLHESLVISQNLKIKSYRVPFNYKIKTNIFYNVNVTKII